MAYLMQIALSYYFRRNWWWRGLCVDLPLHVGNRPWLLRVMYYYVIPQQSEAPKVDIVGDLFIRITGGSAFG